MKICPYYVTPSMRCTKEENHINEEGNENHVSLGIWVGMTEILEYAIGVMRKNGLENSALYIQNEMVKVGLL